MTTTTTLTRPFRVLGVQQIAIGGPSKAALRRLWVDLFGVPAIGTFRSARENVDEDILAVAGVEIDLMEPIDPALSPKVHEPRLNHIGLWVDDLAAAVTWLGGQGVRFAPGGIRRGAAGHDVCFIHPKGDAQAPLSGEGVLIELVQAPPDVIVTLGVPPAST
jgi:lactoylglutathione lyase